MPAPRIEVVGRLVQEGKDPGLGEEGGQQDLGLFPAAEGCKRLPEEGRVDAHQVEFPFDLPLFQLWGVCAEVVPGKGSRVCYRLGKVGEGKVARYPSLVVELTHQDLHQGRLPSAVSPEEAQFPATVNGQLTISEKRRLPRIGEVELLNGDVSHFRSRSFRNTDTKKGPPPG